MEITRRRLLHLLPAAGLLGVLIPRQASAETAAANCARLLTNTAAIFAGTTESNSRPVSCLVRSQRHCLRARAIENRRFSVVVDYIYCNTEQVLQLGLHFHEVEHAHGRRDVNEDIQIGTCAIGR